MINKEKVLKYIFNNRVFYLSQDGIKGDSKSPLILILNRNCYYECDKVFNFTSVKDIKTAIGFDRLEYSPFDTDLFFVKKISEDGNKATANLWFIKPEYVEQINEISPMFIIPETFLIAHNENSSDLIKLEVEDFNDLLIYGNKTYPVKSINGKISSAAFARNCSLSDFKEQKLTFSSLDAYISYLKKILCNIDSKFFISFFQKKLTRETFKLSKEMMILLSMPFVIFVLYNLIYLYMSFSGIKALEAEYRKVSVNAGHLLDKKKKFDEKKLLADQLVKNIKNYNYRSEIINNASKSAAKGTLFNYLEVTGETLIISGISENAPLFLESLSRNKMFSNVRFESKIVKDRETGKDLFKIRCRILNQNSED